MISDLHGSQSSFTWVVAASLRTTTVSTPIWGRLADLVDRKNLIQLALIITVLSSAAAGLSHDIEMLISMRTLQGITIHYDTSFVLVGVYMFVLGAGVGALMQNLVLAAQNTLEIQDIGSGTATVAFFRTLGGAVGVSALGAVLGSRVTTLMIAGLTKLGIDLSALRRGTSAIPNVSTLPGPLRTVVEASYGRAVADLFLVAVPIALVTLVAILFLNEVPLGRRSGVELRLEVAQALSADDADARRA